MKCPNCGNEIAEDKLLCELCGSDIQIVPDFEPELENSISETLSTLLVTENEAEPETESDSHSETESENDSKKSGDDMHKMHTKLWLMVSSLLFLIICVITLGIWFARVRSVDYQIDKARECADGGDYLAALRVLGKAANEYPTNPDVIFLQADYYYLLSQKQEANDVLMKIIAHSEEFETEAIEKAYDKVIIIYANAGEYDKINALLKECEYETIVNIYQGYMAMEPEFSYVEGSYAEVIPLKLSSNTSGTIYYTLDGTTPTENSMVYTAPIFLEMGDYVINAFFVNDYGIRSECVCKKYNISLSIPNAPEVSLYSGEYYEPTMIVVEEADDGHIFYTTDESEPTLESVPYTGPIPMPLGSTSFKFASISDEGVSSEVTMRTYTLRLRGAIPTSQAVSALMERLIETGYIQDLEGHKEGQNGTFNYQFSSVIKVPGDGNYYTIYEYCDDGTGIVSRTDKVFLVEVYQGTVARLGYDENGNFVAVPI